MPYIKKPDESWENNERKIRIRVILLLLAVVVLILCSIFYPPVWAIVSNIAIIIGLAVNLLVLYEKGKNIKK